MDTTVVDVPERGRFEIRDGDRVVGLASYHVDDGVMTLPHTEVGAGAALLDGRVLDDVFSYGKHLFAVFGADTLHVHLGLYGTYLTGTGTPPPARGALRMRWMADGPDGAGVWTDLRGPTACEVLA